MRITDMLAGAFGRVVGFLPNLLAALLIVVVGFFVASLLGRLARKALTAVGLDRRPSVQRLFGTDASLERVPRTGGRIVYWMAALITVGLAIDTLNLAWLSAGVARVLGYVPSLLAAGVIVAVAYVVGNFAYSRLMERRDASPFMARLARGAVYVIAGFMALQQLGIATAIVTTAFTVALSAMAIAGALAFGLGNRELAGRITKDWYERRGPRFQRYDSSRDDEDRPGAH